jgi:hypothetical protein
MMRSGCRSVIGGCLAGAKPATNPDSSMKKGEGPPERRLRARHAGLGIQDGLPPGHVGSWLADYRHQGMAPLS